MLPAWRWIMTENQAADSRWRDEKGAILRNSRDRTGLLSPPIDVPEVPLRRDAVANPLFQFGDFGKASLFGTRPHGLPADTDDKDAAGADPERHTGDLFLEGRE